ncbi:hypothetical protein O181_091889 [Austropuccinia psidii MF-1]|uniref:Reverse transcriptase domain-containing protein n=1 Tax=Austropuccinia psidii MF-1 TaxID=1389203 RepID=A0A9Q3IYF5_9BASI|nr:hypothetical protein [Austropuccinia psidii MF-1]
MKESGHVYLYIADFRSSISRIGDCGESEYIFVYRRGLASRLLDQFASHLGTFYTLQELMDTTLELDTRYHERQKEKCSSADIDLPPSSFHASLEEQWDKEEEPEEIETVLKVVPPAYQQYLDVFSKVEEEKVPPDCTCDHHIKLEGLLPTKGLIRPSSSSTGAPVLFVKKKDVGLCLGVDYCKLNSVTRKNRYPVPSMNQLLTILNSSTIFSKVELHGAYKLLRIKEGDEHLIAFSTKYGSYEYLVIPFDFTNAPASFQNLVNDIFSDFLHIFVIVYLDNVMVFSSSVDEHVKHVALVLERLGVNNMFSKASKCVSHAPGDEYLAYVVSIEVLKMYSSKDSPFIFNEEALSYFQILKEAFTNAPILSHFNPSLPAIVDTDASDYVLGALLSQVNDSGKNPIAFDSHMLLPPELNYEIHQKELFGIVWALKHCRAFLLSLSNSAEVLTDHFSLQYFMSSKVLTCCQARWAEFLSEFHFTITHLPGRLAILPGALSCGDDVYPERGVDLLSKNPQNVCQLIKQDGIQKSIFFSIMVEIFSDLVYWIQKEVWKAKYCSCKM